MVLRLFGLGKKKPRLKLESRQEIELEIVSGDSVENHFTRVLSVERKRIVVGVPGGNKIRAPLSSGDPLTVTCVDADLSSLSVFETKVLDRREREMDLALPTDITEEHTPIRDAEFTIEIPVPVEYRAMSTAYLQTATTRAITSTGIDITTNLAIPPGTSLHIELQIPSATVKTQGRVTQSQKLPGEKKFLTQIEFEDITPADKESVYRYALYFAQRQRRKLKREQAAVD